MSCNGGAVNSLFITDIGKSWRTSVNGYLKYINPH